LAPLLVVIELISYIFRPISLGVRLFANLTAGHSLLAIIAGFSSTMIATNTILWSMIATIPCVILAILGLELAVAFYRLTYLLCYVFILKMLLNSLTFAKAGKESNGPKGALSSFGPKVNPHASDSCTWVRFKARQKKA
jgi:hypothetical protein